MAINAITGDDVDNERRLLLADQKALRPSKTKSPDKPLREMLGEKSKRPDE